MTTRILLPGALGYKEQFNELKKTLEGNFSRVECVDLPLHGSQPYAISSVIVPDMAEALLIHLDQMGIRDEVDIFGHSLGGYLGLYLCRTHPERIRRVFTLGTKWDWTPEIAQKETFMLNTETMALKIPKYVQHLQKVHKIDWKELVEAIRILMTDLGSKQYLKPENLKDIQHKVRISLGDRDQMVHLEETINTYRSLEKGELQIFPSTVHPYEKMNLEKLSPEILNFFNL